MEQPMEADDNIIRFSVPKDQVFIFMVNGKVVHIIRETWISKLKRFFRII